MIINTVNLSSTNLVNVNIVNHELIAPNIPNLKILKIHFHILIQESFLFLS